MKTWLPSLDGSKLGLPSGRGPGRILQDDMAFLTALVSPALQVMSDAEYAEWLRNHFLAETSIDHREELLLESAMRLENKLTLLGR